MSFSRTVVCILLCVLLPLTLLGCGRHSTSQPAVESTGQSIVGQESATRHASNTIAPTGAELGLDGELDLADKDDRFQSFLPSGHTTSSDLLSYKDRSFTIYFRDHRNYINVNTLRAAVRNSQITEAIINGETIDVSDVDPEDISTSFLSADPPPEEFQLAPNMLSNTDYIGFTRFLADKYDLILCRDLYFERCNWAIFSISDSITYNDLATFVDTIQRENNDIIEVIDPFSEPQLHSYHPEYWDPKSDQFTPSGSGINSHDQSTWQGDEGYGIYQCNFQKAHASWFSAPNAENTHPKKTGAGISVFVLDTGAVWGHVDLPAYKDQYFIWPNVDPSREWPAITLPVADPSNPDFTYWDCREICYNRDGISSYTPGELPRDDFYITPGFGLHGMKVSSILTARGEDFDNAPTGICGTLPYGTVIPFLVMSGEHDDVRIGEAIVRAYAIRNNTSTFVANLSLGSGPWSHPRGWQIQILRLIEQDPRFMLVCSAGNSDSAVFGPRDASGQLDPLGEYSAYYPAGLAVFNDQVISVGGLHGTDGEPRLYYASWPWEDGNLDPHTPGNSIRGVTVAATSGSNNTGDAVLTAWHNNNGPGDAYDGFSGTSAAAPFVAGLCALIQAYAPELAASQIRRHIYDTGRTTTYDGSAPLAPFASGSAVLPAGYTPTYVVPIIDAGNAMSWIDVTNPYNDPSFGTLQQVGGPITLTADYHLAGGELLDDAGTATARWYVSQAEDPYEDSILIGEAYSDPDDFELIFNPAAFPELELGEAFIYVEMTTCQGRTLTSHPVPFENADPWTSIDVRTSGTGYLHNLALGADETGKLHVAWTKANPIERTTSVYLSVEASPNSRSFLSDILVDTLNWDGSGYTGSNQFPYEYINSEDTEFCTIDSHFGLKYHRRTLPYPTSIDEWHYFYNDNGTWTNDIDSTLTTLYSSSSRIADTPTDVTPYQLSCIDSPGLHNLYYRSRDDQGQWSVASPFTLSTTSPSMLNPAFRIKDDVHRLITGSRGDPNGWFYWLLDPVNYTADGFNLECPVLDAVEFDPHDWILVNGSSNFDPAFALYFATQLKLNDSCSVGIQFIHDGDAEYTELDTAYAANPIHYVDLHGLYSVLSRPEDNTPPAVVFMSFAQEFQTYPAGSGHCDYGDIKAAVQIDDDWQVETIDTYPYFVALPATVEIDDYLVVSHIRQSDPPGQTSVCLSWRPKPQS